MKQIRATLITIAFLLSSTPLSAYTNTMWIAFSLDRICFTNYDVYQHMELKYLNPILKAALFRSSNSMADYQQKKDDWLRANHASDYQQTYKDLVWYKLLEYEASIIRRNPSQNSTLAAQRFFQNNRDELDQRVNNFLENMLYPIMKVKAIELFVERLKAAGWPHRPTDNFYTIYRSWKNDRIGRIRSRLQTTDESWVLAEWDKLETRVLRPIIRANHQSFQWEAITVFAKELKKSYYPHPLNDYRLHEGEEIRDDDPAIFNIYRAWLDEQEERITEEIRLEEVARMEEYGAGFMVQDLDPRPADIRSFYRQQAALFQELVNNGITTPDNIQRVNNNPRLAIVAKSLDAISGVDLKLSRLKSLSNGIFTQVRDNFISNFLPLFADQQVEKIVGYENRTHLMLANSYLQTHDDRNVAIAKLLEVKELYASSEDYGDLMKSRLYDLAAGLLEKNKENEDYRPKVRNILSETFAQMLTYLSNSNTYNLAENQEKCLADIAKEKLQETFSALLKDESDVHLHDIISKLALWFLKFQMKKTAIETAPSLMIGELDSFSNAQVQVRIRERLRNENLAQGKVLYARRLINKHLPIIVLNPEGTGRLNEDQTREFLLP